MLECPLSWCAAAALGDAGCTEAIDLLGECLLDEDEGHCLRHHCVTSLRKLGGRAATSYLGRTLGANDRVIAHLARSALEDLGERRGTRRAHVGRPATDPFDRKPAGL